MGTTKLDLYKRAVRNCEQTPISSLTETVEPRFRCDDFYDSVLVWILEQQFWRSAMKTVKIELNESIDPAFAFTYAHDLPTDFVKKQIISLDEFLDFPLDEQQTGNAYLMEGGYIWANSTPIYMRYVSNDSSYGLDLTRWTDGMAEAFGLELAARVAPHITGSTVKAEDLHAKAHSKQGKAGTFDQLQQTTARIREGNWSSIRFRGSRDSSLQRGS